ncbi:hypothetical protein DFQ27_000589 [Actinomortierella ambigua]|uniref:Transmembrane protein 198 n=1 Tax=Actinomortierella ambigua TaxID=1343610 RepID=A0A9P6U8S0_9FUNG|nr:hypothetical protein DFQ27_000589 [Actinomortierella ambigua]
MLFAGFIIWSSTVVMIMLIVDINSGTYQSSGLYFGIWLAVGLVGAIVSFYLWHVGIILTGAYASFVVVAVIFTAANLTNYVVRYTILAVVVVAGGILTRKYERMAVILATSFGGSYCFFFGLDMFVQTGFRSTMHVILSQSKDRFHPIPGTWVMIALVPVLAIIGIIYELHRHEEPVAGWWFGEGARPLPPLPGEKRRKCCGFVMSSPAPKKIDAETQDAEANHSRSSGGVGGDNSGMDRQKEGRFCGLFQKKAAKAPSTLTSASATTLTANTKAQVSTAHQDIKVSAKIAISSTTGDESVPPAPPKPATPKIPLKQRWRNCVGTLCCAPSMKQDATKQKKDKRVTVAVPEMTNMTEARVRVTTHPAGEKQPDVIPDSSASKPSASNVQSGPGHIGKHKVVIQKHVREYSLEIEDKW